MFRTMFYTSLGRLLMVDLGEDEDRFEAFMIPLTQAFESLGQVEFVYINILVFFPSKPIIEHRKPLALFLSKLKIMGLLFIN